MESTCLVVVLARLGGKISVGGLCGTELVAAAGLASERPGGEPDD